MVLDPLEEERIRTCECRKEEDMYGSQGQEGDLEFVFTGRHARQVFLEPKVELQIATTAASTVPNRTTDDTSTESLPVIDFVQAKEDKSPSPDQRGRAADNRAVGDLYFPIGMITRSRASSEENRKCKENHSRKRKITGVDVTGASSPKARRGGKPGVDSRTTHKHQKMTGKPKCSPKRTSLTKKTAGKNSPEDFSKGTVAHRRGTIERLRRDNEARAMRMRKTPAKLLLGNENETQSGGSRRSQTYMDLWCALRVQEEKFAALQVRVNTLETIHTGNTGLDMIHHGVNFLEPAKDMMMSAANVLKTSQEMIMKGTELMHAK